MTGLTKAEQDVLAERQRHITAEGWTPKHDDEHSDGSLAVAAACYAIANHPHAGGLKARDLWEWTGWGSRAFKPWDSRRNLVRAAALLLAEIERMDRGARSENDDENMRAWEPAMKDNFNGDIGGDDVETIKTGLRAVFGAFDVKGKS